MELAFTEIIVENEETSTSVPPAPVEEEVEEEQESKEVVTEEEPAEQQVEVPVAVEEPIAVEEPVAVKEPPLQTVVEEEALAVEQEASAVEQEEEHTAEPEVEVEEQVELQEKSSVVEKSAATSVSASVWTFVADKVSFSIGVAFFEILGSNGDGDELRLTKRYSDFKVLHADMAKIMTREELPSMPGTSFLQGRNDKALLQERETVFVEMLNAIAQHPEASQSASFAAFLV
ncbi:hypothetical protein DVH05_011610 [Phytophthora capsici]|nr:hypothetical protein DVH05_011610 [Phytophthora capsici]